MPARYCILSLRSDTRIVAALYESLMAEARLKGLPLGRRKSRAEKNIRISWVVYVKEFDCLTRRTDIPLKESCLRWPEDSARLACCVSAAFGRRAGRTRYCFVSPENLINMPEEDLLISFTISLSSQNPLFSM